MAGIHCAIEPGDEVAAQNAAAWTQRFYSDVSASIKAGVVSLASGERSASGLQVIWQSSLTNEKLLARGAGCRAAVLEALVR